MTNATKTKRAYKFTPSGYHVLIPRHREQVNTWLEEQGINYRDVAEVDMEAHTAKVYLCNEQGNRYLIDDPFVGRYVAYRIVSTRAFSPWPMLLVTTSRYAYLHYYSERGFAMMTHDDYA